MRASIPLLKEGLVCPLQTICIGKVVDDWTGIVFETGTGDLSKGRIRFAILGFGGSIAEI